MAKIHKIALIFLFFGAFPAFAGAANFYFSPEKGQHYQNDNFVIQVLVNTNVPINAVQGTVTFPTEYLNVLNIGKDGIVDLWTQKPSFSNSSSFGNVNFEGIILNPGFSGSAGKIIDITFRVKKAGSADLAFSNFSILANDGLGTSIASPAKTANFTLLSPSLSSQSFQSPSTGEPSTQDLKEISQRISIFEEIFKKLSTEKSSGQGILDIWNILPYWIKISVIVLIGIATIALLFIIISLTIIILIWLWTHIWYNRREFIRWLKASGRWMSHLARNICAFLRLAEKEVAGDVEYAIKELEQDVEKALGRPSFKKIFKDYWVSIWGIIKRFFTLQWSKKGPEKEEDEKDSANLEEIIRKKKGKYL